MKEYIVPGIVGLIIGIILDVCGVETWTVKWWVLAVVLNLMAWLPSRIQDSVVNK